MAGTTKGDLLLALRGEDGALVPGIADGLRGMALIETAVHASARGAGWVETPTTRSSTP